MKLLVFARLCPSRIVRIIAGAGNTTTEWYAVQWQLVVVKLSAASAACYYRLPLEIRSVLFDIVSIR